MSTCNHQPLCSRLLNIFIFTALFLLLLGSTESFAATYRRRGPPPPTTAQTKAFLELAKQLDQVAVNLVKLQHTDEKFALPSVEQHTDLADEEKRSMATEIKTILDDVGSQISTKNLHSNHIRILKDKIAYYKKKLSALSIPTDSSVSKSKKENGKN